MLTYTVEGLATLNKTQSSTNELIRRTQQILDERKAKGEIKAMKVKEKLETRQAMRLGRKMGNIRSTVKTASVVENSHSSGGDGGGGCGESSARGTR